MDPSLFQIHFTGVVNSLERVGMSDVRASACSDRRIRKRGPSEKLKPKSSNLDRGLFFVLQAILGLTFFLPASPTLAQNVASNSGISSPQVQTSGGINQRLELVSENLAGVAMELQTRESRIGPDDLLNISVFEAPEMNCTVRVSASGQISLQLLGAVHAAGLTPMDLESVLQDLLRRTYMKAPHVGVFVQELQSHSVSVVGAVKMPGVFQIRGTKTVIEVLSMAEGLADDAGDTLLIMHNTRYAEAERSAGPDSPQAGIATRPAFHEVFANFNGPQPLTPEEKGEVEEINLKKLLESDGAALNVQVRPGDIVKVSRAGIVYVVGEVRKPGGFVLQNNENISVLQALALAQGTTHTSAISQARIIRTDPTTGKRTEIPMNLGKILSGKRPDELLQPRDVVFVPNSAAKSVLYRGSEAALQTATGAAIYRW
jgi:polysaccharide biosynthesis/export protein